jgi:hypothetical protein
MPNNPNQSDRDRHESERHGGWQDKPGQQQGQNRQRGQNPGKARTTAQATAGPEPGKPGQQSGMSGGSAKPGQR